MLWLELGAMVVKTTAPNQERSFGTLIALISIDD